MVGMIIQEPLLRTQSSPSRQSSPSKMPNCSTRLQNHLKSLVSHKTYFPIPHPQKSQVLDYSFARDLNFIEESTQVCCLELRSLIIVFQLILFLQSSLVANSSKFKTVMWANFQVGGWVAWFEYLRHCRVNRQKHRLLERYDPLSSLSHQISHLKLPNLQWRLWTLDLNLWPAKVVMMLQRNLRIRQIRHHCQMDLSLKPAEVTRLH